MEEGFPGRTASVMDAQRSLGRIERRHLVNHALRSRAYARYLAKRDREAFDSEVLAVAALLHDVGLAKLAQRSERFEVRSARVAADLPRRHGWSPARIDAVREAVILHMRSRAASATASR